MPRLNETLSYDLKVGRPGSVTCVEIYVRQAFEVVLGRPRLRNISLTKIVRASACMAHTLNERRWPGAPYR